MWGEGGQVVKIVVGRLRCVFCKCEKHPGCYPVVFKAVYILCLFLIFLLYSFIHALIAHYVPPSISFSYLVPSSKSEQISWLSGGFYGVITMPVMLFILYQLTSWLAQSSNLSWCTKPSRYWTLCVYGFSILAHGEGDGIFGSGTFFFFIVLLNSAMLTDPWQSNSVSQEEEEEHFK